MNIILSVLVVFLSVVLGYWFTDKERPVDFNNFEILNPIVKPGESLKVKYTINRKKICHVRLQQVTFDAEGVRRVYADPMLQDYTLYDPGDLGMDSFTVLVPIPPDTAEGKGRYRFIRSYACNPLQLWLSLPIIVTSPYLEYEVKK